MYNRIFVIGAVLAATLIAGAFATTPMAAYAGGDYSGTDTEQKIKQKNVGGEGASQFNCAQNNIGEESAVEIDVDACGTIDVSVLEEILGVDG
jgi:hypothetical protein